VVSALALVRALVHTRCHHSSWYTCLGKQQTLLGKTCCGDSSWQAHNPDPDSNLSLALALVSALALVPVLARASAWEVAPEEATAPDTNDHHNFQHTFLDRFWCKTYHQRSRCQQHSQHPGSTNPLASEALALVAVLVVALAKVSVEDKEPTFPE